MEHVHDTIRRIARLITHEAGVTDQQIVSVARAQGCQIPEVATLSDLDLMGNFKLGKHMVIQAKIAGLSDMEMVGAVPGRRQ